MENSIYVVSDNPQIDFSKITRIEYNGQLVLTTEQLADFYGTKINNIQVNFKNNADRFIEGKHYFKLEGNELEVLRLKNFQLQISPKSRVLYLWTKRGCARHCKSVGTDRAWEVFELLEDVYFNVEKILTDNGIKNITDFERGKALAQLAMSAKDPSTKKRLVAKAANLILGEEFIKFEDINFNTQILLQF